MRRPFLQLLWKELRHSLNPMLFYTGASLLLYFLPVFVPGLRGIPLQNTLWLFVILMPLQALPFWVIWRAIATWRREWTGNHMLLILSLPVPGWQITSAKLLALFLEVLLYGMVHSIGFMPYMLPEFSLTLPGYLTLSLWVAGGALYLALISCCFFLTVHFAYLAGRLVSRGGWLVALAAFFTSLWAAIRLGGLLSPLLQWLPRVPFYGLSIASGTVNRTVIYIQVAPLVGVLLVLALLFWLSARWVERDLEA